MSLKLVNGKWFYRKMINGHTIARSTKTADKKLAEQIAATWEADAIKSIMIAGEKPESLHRCIEAFLKARKGTGGYTSAELHLRRFKRGISDKPMGEIPLWEPQAVIAGMREEGKAHNTICVAVAYWNALQNHCTEQGWVSGPKLPAMKPQRTRIRFLTPEEERRIFEAIDPAAKYRGWNPIKEAQRKDNQDLLICLIHLGARLNEVQKMKWGQVDFENNVVNIARSKGGIDGPVVMTRKLRSVLERRKAAVDDVHVFPTKAKGKVNTKWIRAAVQRAGINEDLGKVTLHTARHTKATRMLQGGMSIVEVQGELGHKNLNSTTVYLHVIPSAAAKRAAEILDQV